MYTRGVPQCHNLYPDLNQKWVWHKLKGFIFQMKQKHLLLYPQEHWKNPWDVNASTVDDSSSTTATSLKFIFALEMFTQKDMVFFFQQASYLTACAGLHEGKKKQKTKHSQLFFFFVSFVWIPASIPHHQPSIYSIYSYIISNNVIFSPCYTPDVSPFSMITGLTAYSIRCPSLIHDFSITSSKNVLHTNHALQRRDILWSASLKSFFPPQTSFPLVLVACMKPTFKCVRVPGFSEEGTLSARINSAALLSTGFVRFLWSSLSHLSFSVMVIRGAKGRLTARELKALPWFGPQRKMRKKARLDFKSSLSASWLFEKNSSTAAIFFPLSVE